MPRPAPQPQEPTPLDYITVGLGWLIPGLGHFLIGEKARGTIFAATVHGLFAAGMLIGGYRAINPDEQPIWSYTQYLAGWPMIVATQFVQRPQVIETNLSRQAYDSRRTSGTAAEDEEYLRQRPGPWRQWSPHTADLGSVYCGIAGMLNLLVVFDCLLRVSGGRGTASASAAPTPGKGATS